MCLKNIPKNDKRIPKKSDFWIMFWDLKGHDVTTYDDFSIDLGLAFLLLAGKVFNFYLWEKMILCNLSYWVAEVDFFVHT